MTAEVLKYTMEQVEALVGRTISGVVDDEVSRWLAERDSVMYGRLVAVGLAPGEAATGAEAIRLIVRDWLTGHGVPAALERHDEVEERAAFHQGSSRPR